MKEYRILALVGMLSLFSFNAALAADQYAVDPVHSHIGFSVKHLVITNVKGDFTDYSGTIVYDEKDITQSSVNVTIKTASIHTGNQQRDDDLRSPNFLDAAQYPEMTFKSTRIEPKEDGYLCTGMLTLHGVSKEISIPFDIEGPIKDPWGKTRIGVEATLSLNRQDYGIKYDKALDNGGAVVGNKVKISLNVEGIKQEAAV